MDWRRGDPIQALCAGCCHGIANSPPTPDRRDGGLFFACDLQQAHAYPLNQKIPPSTPSARPRDPATPARFLCWFPCRCMNWPAARHDAPALTARTLSDRSVILALSCRSLQFSCSLFSPCNSLKHYNQKHGRRIYEKPNNHQKRQRIITVIDSAANRTPAFFADLVIYFSVTGHIIRLHHLYRLVLSQFFQLPPLQVARPGVLWHIGSILPR